MAKKVRNVIAVLEANSWTQVRQRGSHRQFRHPESPLLVTVQGKRSDTLKPGTLANIRRNSGIEELR